MTGGWKAELVVAGALLLFGVLLLPVAVYWVGQQIIGEYTPEGGLLALIGAIWSDLATGNPLAWILVLSPYVFVLLLRLTWLAARRRNVNGVTFSDEDQ